MKTYSNDIYTTFTLCYFYGSSKIAQRKRKNEASVFTSVNTAYCILRNIWHAKYFCEIFRNLRHD